MGEKIRSSEQPTQPFLKRLFLVIVGIFVAGFLAKELLPMMFHMMRPEMREIMDSQAGEEVVRRGTHQT